VWLLRLSAILAAIYGAVLLLAYLLQDSLLYFPDRSLPPPDRLKALGLRSWPQDGPSFRGYTHLAPLESPRGTVVVFHGNAGAAWDREYFVKWLVPLGYRVVLAEYPGYGGRDGKMGERAFVSDARETVALAHQEFGGPLFLCGESLGCGVAAGVAARAPVPVAGAVMVTPWDNLPALAQGLYPFLPARWLLRDTYDNGRNLEGFPSRVAVAVAEQDEIVPKSHGIRLYEGLGGQKRFYLMRGAGHNTWQSLVGIPWWEDIMAFLSANQTLSGDQGVPNEMVSTQLHNPLAGHTKPPHP